MPGNRLAIGKLAGAIRTGIMDPTTSPNSPLDFIKSPSKPNKSSTCSSTYGIGGIGLGIVAALDNYNNNNNNNNNTNNNTNSDHHQGKVLARYAFYGQFSAQLGPIRPTTWAEDGEKGGTQGGLHKGSSIISNVTCTYHGTCSNNKSIMASTVYHEASEFGNNSRENVVVPKISPARLAGDRHFSGPDFLSSCHLCKKPLHGKDIYMYGGEKAFCSTECRQRQIRMDERKEQYRSSEPCSYTTTNTSTKGEILFSTGVVAL